MQEGEKLSSQKEQTRNSLEQIEVIFAQSGYKEEKDSETIRSKIDGNSQELNELNTKRQEGQ